MKAEGQKKGLVLEHLAPYLPYGLRVSARKNLDKTFYTGQLCEVTYKSNHGDWGRVKFDDCIEVTHQNYDKRFSNFHTYFICEDEIKPILRPLSDLTKSEGFILLNKLFPNNQFAIRSFKVDKGYLTIDDANTNQHYVVVKPGIDGGMVLNMSNKITDYNTFLKFHLDVFGLIDEGLAIDLNTLSQGEK